MRKLLLVIVGLLLLTVGPAWGTTFDFNREGVVGEWVNGLFSQMVEFTTPIDGYINAVGNGNFTNLTSPHITLTDTTGSGDDRLNIHFYQPTSTLSFAAAFADTTGPLTNGFSVSLSTLGDDMPLIFNVNTAPASAGMWNQGVFNYSGAAITEAIVTFNYWPAGTFVVGDLTYGGSPVPLPPTVMLLGSGLLGLLGYRRMTRS
jgi:hypothetical protein